MSISTIPFELSEDSSDSETDDISHNIEYLQDDSQDIYSIIDEHEELIKILKCDDCSTSNEDTESKKSRSEITILYAFVLLSFQSTF